MAIFEFMANGVNELTEVMMMILIMIPIFFTTTQFIKRFNNSLCNKYMLHASLVTTAYSEWKQQPTSTLTTVRTLIKQLWSTKKG